jgi:uncharacterized membrane protein HdeD (DUF308 family)
MTQQFSQVDINRAVAAAKQTVADNWGWFLTLGIVLVVAGIAAIMFPLVSTIAAKIALGWIFLAAGVVMIIHAFSIQKWGGFLMELLLGVLYLVAGGWLAFFPLTGIVTLTILLAALFLAEGVVEVIMGFRVRPHEGWGWLVFSGLIAVAVGLLIAAELPSSAVWAIGLLVGVNLLSTGISFIVVALAGKRGTAPAGAVTA